MRFKKIIKLFDNGNVCVCGLRGKGKDLIFGNVIARKKSKYISNICYDDKGKHIPLSFGDIDLGQNTYKNLIINDVKYYAFPYEYGTDIYLSDCGVYFPSQYCNELNRDYKYMPMFQALSRQVAHNNFHINVQNLNRCWDKIREQSDTYIYCDKCFYLFGLVIQRIILYDKYESCCNRVKPCRISMPLFADKVTKQQTRMYLDNFYNSNGSVKSKWLFYINKSKHDTYYFEKKFKRLSN